MSSRYYKIEVKLQQRDQAITLAKAIDALMVKNGIAGEAELATVRDVVEVDPDALIVAYQEARREWETLEGR
jgi:hypothetical protein